MPNAWRTHFSFSVWHLLSLERIVRVNRGAGGALERFEELKKKGKMKIFVASAHFSFVAWIVSDLNSETCLEISKVMFRMWSVVRFLLWAWEPLHFLIFVFALRARVHLVVHVPLDAHPRTCMPFTCLFFIFYLLIFFCSPLVFFLFYYYGVPLPLPLSLHSVTWQRSFMPRWMATPQLCSSCWWRGQTRRQSLM